MACCCSFRRQVPVFSNFAAMRLLSLSLFIILISLLPIECQGAGADMRLTSDTLAALTFSSRAVSRTPRPSSSAARMRSILNGVVLGLPNRLPDALARSRPARTRSRIIDLSNSLNTPSMPNKARPDGVLVSRACWCRKRSTSRDRSSPSRPIRSDSERCRRLSGPALFWRELPERVT